MKRAAVGRSCLLTGVTKFTLLGRKGSPDATKHKKRHVAKTEDAQQRVFTLPQTKNAKNQGQLGKPTDRPNGPGARTHDLVVFMVTLSDRD